jgi:hypothetical protein
VADFSRPAAGWRYKPGSMKLNVAPDAVGSDKYPLIVNARFVGDSSVQTRPGLAQLFATSGGGSGFPITDIRAYSRLSTDDRPRYLARDSNGRIWLDNGLPAGSGIIILTPDGQPGASMIPFRPNQSPDPYMYIANGVGYDKFSAPSATNVVTQQRVGIAEPQTPVDASIYALSGAFIGPPPALAYTLSGTASGGSTGNRVSDTVVALFNNTNQLVMQVGSAINYQRFMVIVTSGGIVGTETHVVEDVFPPLPGAIAISAIYYFSGTTGRCVVVPAKIAAGPGDQGESLYSPLYLNTLRRGALVQIGSEVCQVLSTSRGPNGTICFETSTTAAHTTADTLTGVPAIQLQTGPPPSLSPGVGQTISSSDLSFSQTTGVGIATATLASNPFIISLVPFREDDYLHFSINISDLSALVELKLLFDVGTGTVDYTNAYYYTVRPNDIQAGIDNTLTQLGVAQLVAQRALIDELNAAESANQGQTASSAQTTPGDNQWSEITFPIRALSRIGGDQTRTLQNARSVRLIVKSSGSVNVLFNGLCVFGGSDPDVGPDGAPYRYRVRPRSSVTGAKGNASPDMRYGVSARRETVVLTLPSAAYDSQIDTWDVFRYGGSVPEWRFIGAVPSTSSSFSDIYGDEAAIEGELLETDNYEPWPTIDVPLVATAGSVVGTTALVTLTPPSNVERFLPGNLVQLGGNNVYTLRTRPTVVASPVYLFEFVENAGAATNIAVNIYEPALAKQPLPYMWGPDASGTVFAVGDQLRPGSFSTSKPNNPDSAPDSYNQELTPPSEPLLGGDIVDGLSFIASSERWWALYPQLDNPAQRYNAVQQPIPRGLAAPRGHCSDGASLYWWAKDGIWSSSKGSLTDEDLYNLFPHEGVAGKPVSYGGRTIQPPDYSRAGAFRLAKVNHYLYATYQDASGSPRLLTLDVRRNVWAYDDHPSDPVTTVYHPEQQAGTVATTPPALYEQAVMGTQSSIVAQEADNANDLGAPIACAVATQEWDAGDIRGDEQWGDVMLDAIPAAPTGLVATPMGQSAALVPATTFAQSAARAQRLVSLGGSVFSNFLGILATWTDDFTQQSVPTELFVWQPALLPKPEPTADRFTDWQAVQPGEGAGWVQGFVMRADTFNLVKSVVVRDSDTLATHSFTPSVIHNGESVRAYSFDQPFIAHQIRLEPQGTQEWRFFELVVVAEPTPEMAETWEAQFTSFGMEGYKHVPRVVGAYAATQPVTLTITSYDGQSPAPITLPATGGAFQKILRVLTANKGQLYKFRAASAAPFQIYLDDLEVLVGPWGRQGGYTNYRNLGGQRGDKAAV